MTIRSATAVRPAAVDLAFWLWLGALGAGLAETLLRWEEAGPGGIAVRTGLYAVLALVMVRMRDGRNWARLTLAVGLGVLGTLSLIAEPIGWLLDGNDLGAAIGRADLTALLVAASRVLHLLCVLAATPLMFTGPAGDYFRTTRVTTQ
ncbi:hypothetical protein GCM10010112_22790 [Actinoplanes lobatus]|uniref:Uncharacterized protein n=1 Tax=Actinoplanes lobatus TaxID=113568 RepID=A0A7W7MIA1_9ACTN|nr:hypothetical protein [Actinoplanes lobatus]MBB4751322.1 hypothetical protein [Actinoplanes lobatus]GGN63490.1 hypothetical protein GCM10010112_22790 [Actinoplanes lobatus]GIE40931.1 hypothetical protein Alo02nite_38290 [Actinoplanes lobatus]